jgi:phage gp29-like protein
VDDELIGGLIRPLAWLYVFKNLALKDLLRYIEKYGMPFIAARLDEQAFEKERRKIAYLVRNFGSDGGGVFTKATELEMLHAPGSSGEVYFRFLEYSERAVARLILGQTSTSDSRDSNRSTAYVHNLVRHDLRADDCTALAATLRRELIRPLVQFNFGPEEPLPTILFQAPVEGDREQESRIVANLTAAGYRLDPATVSARTGYPVLSGPEVAP